VRTVTEKEVAEYHQKMKEENRSPESDGASESTGHFQWEQDVLVLKLFWKNDW
jgi:hypothetical protein